MIDDSKIAFGAGARYPELQHVCSGASVPRHLHTGLETILVLEGTQSDERGDYPAGSVILNPKGTVHSVWSATGCVVLIQWQLPVEFLEETE